MILQVGGMSCWKLFTFFVGLFKPHGKGTKRTILLGIMIRLLPWFVTKMFFLAIILRSRGCGVLGWGI